MALRTGLGQMPLAHGEAAATGPIKHNAKPSNKTKRIISFLLMVL
jgi:hypothetical protein